MAQTGCTPGSWDDITPNLRSPGLPCGGEGWLSQRKADGLGERAVQVRWPKVTAPYPTWESQAKPHTQPIFLDASPDHVLHPHWTTDVPSNRTLSRTLPCPCSWKILLTSISKV